MVPPKRKHSRPSGEGGRGSRDKETPDGVYERSGSRFLWIKWYDAQGRPHRESAQTTSVKEAKRLRDQRPGSVAKGEPIAANANRVRVNELLDDLENDYLVNDKVLEAIEPNVRRLREWFGRHRAVDVSSAHTRAYIAAHRMTEENPGGLSNGTLMRDRSALLRAYSLAQQGTPPKMLYKPHFPRLKEGPPRQGFFEAHEVEAVCGLLPVDLRPVVRFAYITGWRVPSEVLTLTWAQVSFEGGSVRLEPGTTKNDEARIFPFTNDLRALLEEQRVRTEEIQRRTGQIVPHVFHRGGAPIKDFRGAWDTACRGAGIPGRIPHDLRRAAVRNLVRCGVPERVAMKLTGHKTRSVFERYNIVNEADLQDAAAKLNRAERPTGTLTGTVVPIRRAAGETARG
jgi:integrase